MRSTISSSTLCIGNCYSEIAIRTILLADRSYIIVQYNMFMSNVLQQYHISIFESKLMFIFYYNRLYKNISNHSENIEFIMEI